MKGKYVGTLQYQDPLFGFLTYTLSNRLGVSPSNPEFRVFRFSGSNEVYGYEEKRTGTSLICKFFGSGSRSEAVAAAYREQNNLETLRGYGLTHSPHIVIRPLGIQPEINGVLAVEYYGGEQFSAAIYRAIHQQDHDHLYWRLKALAYFLATLHNRTANGNTVNFNTDCDYLDRLVRSLAKRQRIHPHAVDTITWRRDRWRDCPKMWEDRQVWLHGDATPANFMFGEGLEVAALDLERMKRGDRSFDLGRVAGELQHAFLRATEDQSQAEPFIGHFLWEYACHFPDRDQAFCSITARVPYYMSINLLRIARNDWVPDCYARKLVDQAIELLGAD